MRNSRKDMLRSEMKQLSHKIDLGKLKNVPLGHSNILPQMLVDFAKAVDLPHINYNALRLLARFHDIGKIMVPESILDKPGRLNQYELQVVRKHSRYGFCIAQSVPMLTPIANWILTHHEWWNGQGYPLGLVGEEIPLESRLLSIIDAYDAMTTHRPYRPIMTKKEALAELNRYAGIQFDPQLVEKFISFLC